MLYDGERSLCRTSAASAPGPCRCCVCTSRKLLFRVGATCEVSVVVVAVVAAGAYGIGDATARPRRAGVSGRRPRAGPGGHPARADAMSVSFDAIRTEPDAIWRPIAALRPTRCHRPPNYARITQQLGGYVCVCNASPVGIVCRWTTQVEVV